MTQHKTASPNPAPSAPLPGSEGKNAGVMPILGIALILVALIGGGFLAMNRAGGPRDVANGNEESEQPEGEFVPFTKWQKPEVALILSAQMHGYIDPCGCSVPQQGGLPRRYNFIQSLKAKKWDVVGIDLGELPQTKGIHEQNLLKYQLSVKALAAMDYKVMGIGRNELLAPLGEALALIWEERRPYPRPISLTMAEAAPNGAFHKQLNLRQYEIIQAANVKIGVINMMGMGLRLEFKNKEQFLFNQDELPKALNAFAKHGVDFAVILHHEYPVLDPKKFKGGILPEEESIDWRLAREKERSTQAQLCAEFCAQARQKNPKIPPVQLMMVLADEPEPPSFAKQFAPNLPTRVVEIGHKGKYVGLVGVYRDKSGFRVQYEKVLMSPDWQTPVGKERTNPIIVMMEQYNRELKQHNVLEEFVRMPHANQTEPNRKGLTATYVGSNRCKNCHQEAFNVWKGTKHFHGTDTLEDPKKPPVGRQYDPECMKCHTTGFEHPGGYDYPVPVLPAWVPGKRVPVAPDDLKKHNDKLRGVGCESCHGPASEHVKNPDDQRIRDLINPYRPSAQERKFENAGGPQFQKLFDVRMNALNRMCIHCHDSENDVHWLNDGVAKRWLGKGKYQAIIHRTPQAKNNNGGIAPPKEAEPPRANIGEPRPVVNGVNDKKK